jgi:hypothetical protein
MRQEGKPKKQSEKGEVAGVLRKPWSFFLHQRSGKPAALVQQLLPSYRQ